MDHAAPSPDDPVVARLIAIEERLLFQEQALEQLSGLVREQQLAADQLRRDLDAHRKVLDGLAEQDRGENLPYDKPPHY